MIQMKTLWYITGFLVTCFGHPRLNVEEPNAEALQRLLKVFGLDQRVMLTKKPHLPPQYMLDLYHSAEAGGSIGKHRNKVNTVRSFVDKGLGSDFSFDVSSSISSDEEILEAEFHLFTSLNQDRVTPLPHVLMVQLYDGPANDSGLLLEARLISGHASAWEVFRITNTVSKWITQYNRGLSVKILDSLGRDNFHRRIRHQSRKPILVVFSRDPRYSTSKINSNKYFTKPSVPTLLPTLVSDLNNTIDNGGVRSIREALTSDPEACSRRELRVDFERIGWSTWILSPKWYDAYVCSGTCEFPLGQNQRPSNHATVQSIVHELQLYPGIGTPSCVPTELRPINLLYLDEHMNVVLKQYDDMVAAGCGCH